jgi:hypothetical protein
MLVRIARIFAVPREPTTRTVSPGLSFGFTWLPTSIQSCARSDADTAVWHHAVFFVPGTRLCRDTFVTP